MAKGKAAGFSVRTKDATDGGGTEGALATISEIGYVEEFTYGGRHKDKPAAALRVELTIDGFDKPWEQHYSVGPSEKYVVVGDGDGIRSAGKAAGLNKKCPAYAFFDHVEKAAQEAEIDLDDLLPEEEEDGAAYNSVRPLEGRRVRLTNAKYETVGGDMKEGIFIGGFEDEHEAPAKNGKANGKSTGKRSSGDDIAAKTEAAVQSLLEDKPSLKKGDLSNLVYAENRKDPDVKAMMELCFKDSWVGSDDRPWTFDKKKGLLLKAAE